MFHETLSDAVEAGIDALEEMGADFNLDEARRPFNYDGISYPEKGAERLPSKSSHFALDSLKNKNTRKFGHMTIWRHESGRYEVNTYVL